MSPEELALRLAISDAVLDYTEPGSPATFAMVQDAAASLRCYLQHERDIKLRRCSWPPAEVQRLATSFADDSPEGEE